MRRERISSRKNAIINHYNKLSRDKKYRYEERSFVCDGIKLIKEALDGGSVIKSALVDETMAERLLIDYPQLSGLMLYTAPREIIIAASRLKTPQGVLFECEMPVSVTPRGSRFILLDGLQDSGNVGTIIRCADAFSIDAVVCDGCADIYNPKTIRSAMGSLFRVPVLQARLTDIIPRLRGDGISVFAARLDEGAADLNAVNLKKSAVVIGNEGAGARDEVSRLCDGSIIIPMSGRAESLNAGVAAAIFMYEMTR